MNAAEETSSTRSDHASGDDAPILYISFEGMLEPLGRSQVLSYLYGLTELGFRFSLLSLEREADSSGDAASQLQGELQQRGIHWKWAPFRHGGLLDVVKNLWTSWRSARRLCRTGSIGLVHARSYLPAVVARMLQLTRGIPYVFDVRGYWVDERASEGRWIRNQSTYKVGKWVERHLLTHAVAIVTLTEIQAKDFREGLAPHLSECPVVVIPTCADYDSFKSKDSGDGVIPFEITRRLEHKLVVGMVGSINDSYCIREGFTLFREILRLRPDAHLLCLTRQTEMMLSLIREHDIPEVHCTVRAAAYEEMPAWLARMHWALLLLKQDFAKRGSMPTKLAEFFAAEVRVVQYGCNAEVSDKVREAGCGIVLRDLSEVELTRAAQKVADTPLSPGDTAQAREITRSYFGVEVGVQKYAQVLSQFVPRRRLERI